MKFVQKVKEVGLNLLEKVKESPVEFTVLATLFVIICLSCC